MTIVNSTRHIRRGMIAVTVAAALAVATANAAHAKPSDNPLSDIDVKSVTLPVKTQGATFGFGGSEASHNTGPMQGLLDFEVVRKAGGSEAMGHIRDFTLLTHGESMAGLGKVTIEAVDMQQSVSTLTRKWGTWPPKFQHVFAVPLRVTIEKPPAEAAPTDSGPLVMQGTASAKFAGQLAGMPPTEATWNLQEAVELEPQTGTEAEPIVDTSVNLDGMKINFSK